MKKENKIKKFGMLSIFALLLVGILSTGAIAYRGDYKEKGPDYSLERCDEMQNIFENKNYESWKELMSLNQKNSNVLNIVNSDNFEKFIMTRQLAKEGKLEESKALRSELGLNNGQGLKNGEGQRWNQIKQNRRDGSGRERGFGKGMNRKI